MMGRPIDKPRGRKAIYDHQEILRIVREDLTKKDEVVACEVGCSSGCVRRVRRKAGIWKRERMTH